jgi:hypothetical protein
MWSISKDSLDKLPPVQAGDVFTCPTCAQEHVLQAATNAQTGQPDNSILWYKCGEFSKIGAVDGKLIVYR